jgi:hypothetical protein
MAEKGMHGSFKFVSYLVTFYRRKIGAEVERRIDRSFGLMCLQ